MSRVPVSTVPRPVVLMILDGWGYREKTDDNAIAMATTPTWDRLWSEGSHALLQTSGEFVGLPAGQMGNSEVGHMNIGAGRIVYQDLTRIAKAIEDGSFSRNPALCGAIDAALANEAQVHVMGLLSPGGVHSHEDQFFATLRLAAARGSRKIVAHAFLDGRDTPPRSAAESLRRLQEVLAEIPQASLGTVIGRYYAMDRDQRWNRVEQAYRAVACGEAAFEARDGLGALQQAYQRDESDEFVQATRVGGYAGMGPNDAVLFVNFRADRAREISRALVDEDFSGFVRSRIPGLKLVCMTEYAADIDAAVAFPTETLPDLLGEIIEHHGMRQLRIAETEKYAHVTFFFNGGREEPFQGEDRILVPSPQVATYDLQPEMSAPELAEKLNAAIRSNSYDLIVCNVANPDMVGHTGSLAAAIKAVEAVDRCLGRAVEAVDAVGGALLISADHGNVEQMRDPDSGQSLTSHTTGPVPVVLHGVPGSLHDGALRDLAPTVLELLQLPKPTAMTGTSLLTRSPPG